MTFRSGYFSACRVPPTPFLWMNYNWNYNWSYVLFYIYILYMLILCYCCVKTFLSWHPHNFFQTLVVAVVVMIVSLISLESAPVCIMFPLKQRWKELVELQRVDCRAGHMLTNLSLSRSSHLSFERHRTHISYVLISSLQYYLKHTNIPMQAYAHTHTHTHTHTYVHICIGMSARAWEYSTDVVSCWCCLLQHILCHCQPHYCTLKSHCQWCETGPNWQWSQNVALCRVSAFICLTERGGWCMIQRRFRIKHHLKNRNPSARHLNFVKYNSNRKCFGSACVLQRFTVWGDGKKTIKNATHASKVVLNFKWHRPLSPGRNLPLSRLR